MRCRCVASLALCALASASVSEIQLRAGGGARTAITYDGTTLSIPQHCRSDTCNALVDAGIDQATTNEALRTADVVLRDAVMALNGESRALHTIVDTQAAVITTLADGLAHAGMVRLAGRFAKGAR